MSGGGNTRIWIQTREGRLRPVPISTGLQDRSFAELVEGDLEEGQQVIVGAIATSTSQSSQQQTRSPFGGGMMGGPTRGMSGGGRR